MFFYLLLSAAAIIASLVLRRLLTRRFGEHNRQRRQLTPPEIAMLFGEQRAVVAALAELRAADAIDSAATPLRPLGPLDIADPFSRAVYDRMVARRVRDARRLTIEVRQPLAQLRDRLVARALLAGPGYRREVRSAAMPTAAVVALGLVRLAFGVINGNAVGWLMVVLAILTIVLLFQLRTGRRTYLGDQEARVQMRRALQLRRQRRSSPAHSGDAALAAAALGASALWMYDPGLAGASGISPSSDSSSTSGASCGSGSSSCSSSSSSCGSSSSCSSGSSCGGGGGCGG